MKEYIEREQLIETAHRTAERYRKGDQHFASGILDGFAVFALSELPAADVVERVRGEWKALTNCSNAAVYCSVCHKAVVKEQYYRKVKLKFCPNCGADMRGEKHEQ